MFFSFHISEDKVSRERKFKHPVTDIGNLTINISSGTS
jgi:hypothetical protein